MFPASAWPLVSGLLLLELVSQPCVCWATDASAFDLWPSTCGAPGFDDAFAPQAQRVDLLQVGVLVGGATDETLASDADVVTARSSPRLHGNATSYGTKVSGGVGRKVTRWSLASPLSSVRGAGIGGVGGLGDFGGVSEQNRSVLLEAQEQAPLGTRGFVISAGGLLLVILVVFGFALHIFADDELKRMSPPGGSFHGDVKTREANLVPGRSQTSGFWGGGAAGSALANIGVPRESLPPTSAATLQHPTSSRWPPGVEGGTTTGYGPPTATAVSVGPPAVCPSLILPNTEARFMIDLTDLQGLLGQAAGSLDIKGTSSRTLLHLIIDSAPTGQRRLVISSVGCKEHPRTSVLAPLDGRGPLELYGKRDKPYGAIELLPNGGGCVLKKDGVTVMTVQAEGVRRDHPPSDFTMTASAVNGIAIGTAGQVDYKVAGADLAAHRQAWRLTVKPGSDAVLICTCMMANVFLGSR